MPICQSGVTLFIGIIVLALCGCTQLPRNPVPSDQIFDAEAAGVPGVRAWAGEISERFQLDLVDAYGQEPAGEFPRDENGIPVYDALALSGGGATGAFGAGILYGWAQAGERPDFKLVSGISTGALIAPFAFLGTDYDEQLKQVFTSVDSQSIFQRLSFFKFLRQSESLASTAPLKSLIDSYLDDEFIRSVAGKHNDGHRLYIGTHHMDAQRLVVWNMGLIANSSHPDAPELFRKVILASASIPIIFPPVLIKAEVDGETFDEMHADGGLSTQVFFYGGTIDLTAAASSVLGDRVVGYKRSGKVFIVRNGKLGPEPGQVERKLKDITARTVDSMIRSSATGDLYRIYTFAKRDNFEIRYVAVPDDYVPQSTEAFDQQEMSRLFELGSRLGAAGNAWESSLPGTESLDPRL